MRISRLLAAIATLPLLAFQASATDFTLDDLKAMVAELEAVVPENPSYRYPIEVTIPETDVVNAAAGYRLDGEVLQAILMVNTGFIEAVEGDPKMIRAVVAHELAHLALGHSLESSNLGDLNQVLTRQQEAAADAFGVGYLKELGHPEEDFLKLLYFLDSTQMKDYPIWLGVVGSDHASPITRATLIAPNDTTLKALSHLEVGLAFSSCRRYEEAIAWFQSSLSIEPRMHEASVNIALASLQDYYERLPLNVQGEWLRPDFHPHLTETVLLSGRAVEVTDMDLKRFEAVKLHIASIPDGLYPEVRTFLKGTLLVLHPKGDIDAIGDGVVLLSVQLSTTAPGFTEKSKANQLRLANNIAVGLHRLGKTERAMDLLVSKSMQSEGYFLPSAAENVGRMPHGKLTPEQAREALNVTVTYIANTPPNAPNFETVRATMKSLLTTLGLELNTAIEPQALYLCQAIAIEVNGKNLPLFDPAQVFVEALGEPSLAGFFLEKYPDLGCMMWTDNDVVLLTERGYVMKITSYRKDSSIVLKPLNTELRETYRIRVGMSEADLNSLLAPSGVQAQHQLALMFDRTQNAATGGTESWQYYPSLNLGVLIVDGVVAGISVTPVKG